MTHEQAEFLLHSIYIPEIQNEQKTTLRIIEAVPVDKGDWSPDPKSMPALKLAWHLASSECFFMNGVINGKFDFGGTMPESIKTSQDVAAWYNENAPKVAAALEPLKGEQLVQSIDFHGVFNFPAITYLGLMTNHSIHHRGQLSAYLRPMGAKVPRIYGGSGDDPIQLPAAAQA